MKRAFAAVALVLAAAALQGGSLFVLELRACPSDQPAARDDALAADGMLEKALVRRSSTTPPRTFSALPPSLRPPRARDGHHSDRLLPGGAKVFALDRPVEKGRVLLFHRYPDGVYTSIPAEEVARIVANAAQPASGQLAPGDLKVLGHDIEGPTAESAGPPPYYPERAAYSAPGYDYALPWGYGSFGGGGHSSGPPRVPASLVPTNIGPNGFPIIAPRGSPGSTPPPIGSNGFPDISPRREPR